MVVIFIKYKWLFLGGPLGCPLALEHWDIAALSLVVQVKLTMTTVHLP